MHIFSVSSVTFYFHSVVAANWNPNCTLSVAGKNSVIPCLRFFLLVSFVVVVFQGDSGGPLLYNGIAVGITSNGGKKCGQIKKPGIYTIISHYTEWIDNTMSQQPAATQDQSS